MISNHVFIRNEIKVKIKSIFPTKCNTDRKKYKVDIEK